MMVAARALAFLVGSTVVLRTLGSAITTVVMPRATTTLLTRSVFVLVRKPIDFWVHRASNWQDVDRLMVRFAPVSLILLPGVWVVAVMLGFVPIYWALGIDDLHDAFVQSGSSLLTLGFAADTSGWPVVATFAEATIGLGLVALLISFLPTIYAQFSRREVLVSQLDTWASTPPNPLALFRRAHNIGWLDQLDGFWAEWERWFAEIEESHVSFQALPFFRSPQADRSWITAAGAVLDSAALRLSALDLPRSWRAQLCLRSGYLALRSIAKAYDVEFDSDPAPSDPISITRNEFDQMIDDIAALGIAVKHDRDQAWRDFAGWRVNYDVPLVALCGLVIAPYAPWSSDRSINYRVRLMQRRRRNGA